MSGSRRWDEMATAKARWPEPEPSKPRRTPRRAVSPRLRKKATREKDGRYVISYEPESKSP